jgi:hypothetical protein
MEESGWERRKLKISASEPTKLGCADGLVRKRKVVATISVRRYDWSLGAALSRKEVLQGRGLRGIIAEE